MGLAPNVHQSGNNQRTMGMTPRPKRLLRSYFVEASWQAIRDDTVMQLHYRKHQGKNRLFN
ncbi:transposase [Arenibacter algicola]|uniref:transposase n=1 Tax=Arenibacter algicola TaxID=616991 RepID=UPI003D15A7FD